MPANNYPRTSFILRALGITQSDEPWMKPEYSRSGRYIHEGASHLAAGYALDREWFKGTSGSGARDTVVHEDCRPKLNGYAKFQRDHRPQLIAADSSEDAEEHYEDVGGTVRRLPGRFALVHPVYGYSCHPDQILEFPIVYP